MPHFDLYVFADYSGAKEDKGKVKFWKCYQTGSPRQIRGRVSSYSRAGASEEIERLLNKNILPKKRSKRIIFGFDHQYSWPLRLWNLAQLNDLSWREALQALAVGANGRPKLDHPRIYCAQFNEWCGIQAFWTPIKRIARGYNIQREEPLEEKEQRFRRTERAKRYEFWPREIGRYGTKPADAVGGRGEGVVGGQTICGLLHIARLLNRQDIAWWPFDGFSLDDPAYTGKHVAVEIYPEIKRPADVPKSDDNDAIFSCKYVRWHDQHEHLGCIMDLRPLRNDEVLAQRVFREGWILGMDPRKVPKAE